MARKLLSREEAASYLGIGLTTFEEVVQPELPIVRIGRRVLFDVEDLDGWITAQKVRGTSPATEAERRSTTSVGASRSSARKPGVASGCPQPMNRSELLAKLRGGRRGAA